MMIVLAAMHPRTLAEKLSHLSSSLSSPMIDHVLFQLVIDQVGDKHVPRRMRHDERQLGLEQWV